MQLKKVFVVAGPTASGKSSLGLKMAHHLNGDIINADSMQVYQNLRILTARPNEEEMEGIPHHLYGFLGKDETCSVSFWVEKAACIIKEVQNPIIVGGTGLYIDSLMNGLSPIPDVDPIIREQVRSMPLEEVRSLLKECEFQDPQRQRRALEIQLSTGKAISYFQQLPRHKIIDADFTTFFLNPPRPVLYHQCDVRFLNMLEQGAVEEVKTLMELHPTGGVLKALGVHEIEAYLQGKNTKDDMIRQVSQSTRRYAKRQVTWFKHQFKADYVLSDSFFDFSQL